MRPTESENGPETSLRDRPDNDTRLKHGKSAEQALGIGCNGLGQDFGLWLPEKDGQKG